MYSKSARRFTADGSAPVGQQLDAETGASDPRRFGATVTRNLPRIWPT